jgi:hypothetical protein
MDIRSRVSMQMCNRFLHADKLTENELGCYAIFFIIGEHIYEKVQTLSKNKSVHFDKSFINFLLKHNFKIFVKTGTVEKRKCQSKPFQARASELRSNLVKLAAKTNHTTDLTCRKVHSYMEDNPRTECFIVVLPIKKQTLKTSTTTGMEEETRTFLLKNYGISDVENNPTTFRKRNIGTWKIQPLPIK